MKEIFPGVFKEGRKIYTPSEDSTKVYGEKIKNADGKIYREWVASRSKLAAALKNNLRVFPFEAGGKILYLGASTGTTVSHISDIVGNSGIVYAIEFSERMFRSLDVLASRRKNIAPLLMDARKPEKYQWIEECDVIYADISQPDQTQVAVRNADIFLRKGGHLLLSVKSQSIDVTKAPEKVYEEEKKKISSSGYTVLEMIDLEPHEEKHCMIAARKE